MKEVVKTIISKLKEKGINTVLYEMTDEGWIVNIKTNLGDIEKLPEETRELIDVLERTIEYLKPSEEHEDIAVWKWVVDGVEIVKQVLV